MSESRLREPTFWARALVLFHLEREHAIQFSLLVFILVTSMSYLTNSQIVSHHKREKKSTYGQEFETDAFTVVLLMLRPQTGFRPLHFLL